MFEGCRFSSVITHVAKFDMYVEDECAAYVRYCFADPMDAAIFRSRFEPTSPLGSLVERAAHPDADFFNEETHVPLVAERCNFFKVELSATAAVLLAAG
jgi:hypothetical protein